jgi:hypothetical protein
VVTDIERPTRQPYASRAPEGSLTITVISLKYLIWTPLRNA